MEIIITNKSYFQAIFLVARACVLGQPKRDLKSGNLFYFYCLVLGSRFTEL